jgi:hypothetical protein
MCVWTKVGFVQGVQFHGELVGLEGGTFEFGD